VYQPKQDPPVIWLFCGGPSAEHKVSLSSALNVSLALIRSRYQVVPVCIRQSGQWWLAANSLSDRSSESDVRELFQALELERPSELIHATAAVDISRKVSQDPPDCALNLIHGELGEDGVLQGMLEVLGIPYTGSGVLACALSMDKILCQRILAHHRVLVPPHIAVKSNAGAGFDVDKIVEGIARGPGFPCVVKPSNGGSSIGMSMVSSPNELPPALELACDFDKSLIIESRIEGMEVSCGVMDLLGADGVADTVAFPPTEIVPIAGDYFDYQCKYTPGKSEEITPARLADSLLDEIRAIAQRVHSIIGCEGMSRTDMIVSNGKIYTIEINAVPGMTATSLLPQGAAAHGLSMGQLLDQLIQHG
jgi:D-alanine-D-alanine ligase